MTQKAQETAPSEDVVKQSSDGSKLVVNVHQTESPFAALAVVKTDATDAPAITAVVVEMDQVRREGILAGTIEPTDAEVEAFRAEGYELTEVDEMTDTATGHVLTQQELDEFDPVDSAHDEQEVSHQEQAAPVLATEGTSSATAEVAVVSTSENVIGHRPDADGTESGAEAPKRHRRRRGRKDRKPEASASAVASAPAEGAVAGGEATPPAPASQPKPQSRTPQFGGGIRKIVLVPVAVKESVEPPRGSIGPRRFLKFVHPAQLSDLAKELADKGTTPDVVYWSKSGSGFDHIRIKVVDDGKKDRNGNLLSHLEIVDVVGGKFKTLIEYIDVNEIDGEDPEAKAARVKVARELGFADFTQYIGQEIRYGELMGFRSITDDRRTERTVALNTLLVAAKQYFDAIDAKKASQGAKAKQ